MLMVMPCRAAGTAEETATSVTPPSAPEPVFAPIHALTSQDELVSGSTDVPGAAFVVRVRELPGTIVAPHTHTFDENITIVKGIWFFGIGDHFDKSKLHELPVGSFVFIPAGKPMFAYSPEGTIVQLHGIGPYTQKFCHNLTALVPISDDQTVAVTPAAFHFHKDDAVSCLRGNGKIRQGYATGDIIEYEVVKADGGLFMAQEVELKALK